MSTEKPELSYQLTVWSDGGDELFDSLYDMTRQGVRWMIHWYEGDKLIDLDTSTMFLKRFEEPDAFDDLVNYQVNDEVRS